jgi:hypothetical protein
LTCLTSDVDATRYCAGVVRCREGKCIRRCQVRKGASPVGVTFPTTVRARTEVKVPWAWTTSNMSPFQQHIHLLCASPYTHTPTHMCTHTHPQPQTQPHTHTHTHTPQTLTQEHPHIRRKTQAITNKRTPRPPSNPRLGKVRSEHLQDMYIAIHPFNIHPLNNTAHLRSREQKRMHSNIYVSLSLSPSLFVCVCVSGVYVPLFLPLPLSPSLKQTHRHPQIKVLGIHCPACMQRGTRQSTCM